MDQAAGSGKLVARERGPGLARAWAMSSGLYRLLIASGVVFAFSLALAIVDALGWLVLPQAARPFIPIVLVASTLIGIVLLSGSIGIPKNPRLPADAPPPEAGPDDVASGASAPERPTALAPEPDARG